MRPGVLGLVADDLTGAGDAAAGLADSGWRAILSLDPALRRATDPTVAPTVLALSTAARALPDDEAAARTARAVDAVVAAGAERLYLKLDSTVRGSVAGQVGGALTAWSRHHPRARAVVCPAFPAQLRTVVDGEVRVAGAPLASSAAAVDPWTPRTEGDLTRLVPGATRRCSPSTAADLDGPPGARLVVDAQDDADLDRIARLVDDSGPELVVVGSGGLSAALGRRWSAPGPGPARPGVRGRLLVAVSSLHPVSASQLQRLAGGGDDGVDVLTTVTEVLAPDVAASELAGRVAAALQERPYAALVLVGGDGAAAVLVGLGTDRVLVDGALVPGCPTGVVVGGRADGLRVVTKSGGFGGPSALEQIVRELRAPHAPTTHDPLTATSKEAS